jgi:hypothetical protein
MKISLLRTKKGRPSSLYIIFPFVLIMLFTTCTSQQGALDALLPKIDNEIYAECEKDVRESLDKLIEIYGEYGVYPKKNRNWTSPSVKIDLEEGYLPVSASRFLRAYETFGDDAYLQAGLKTADFFYQIQNENGSFPGGAILERGGKAIATIGRKHKLPLGTARMEDAHQYPAFCLMLYAYKLTDEEKYLNSAKKWGKLFLEKIQYPDWGCSPDYWDGKIRPIGVAYLRGDDDDRDDRDRGVPNGGSYSDHATYDGFMTTMAMYHLTKDPQYLKYSSKLGEWLFLTHQGEGATRGWADNYNRLNEPVEARHHEGFNIEPRTANRFTLPMMMWFYTMTGEERYRILFEETIAWLRSMEHPNGSLAPKQSWFTEASLSPVGWSSEYLPDGTEAWTAGYESYRYDQPSTWPQGMKDLGIAKGGHPVYTTVKVVLSGAEKMLAILQSEGLVGWQKLFKGNVNWTPEQFLEKRIEAARRSINTTTVPETLDQKWQFVWDANLAKGEVSLKSAAYGGHGLLKWTEDFTDLWNVHYDWTSRVIAVDNWLDVPIPELQGFMEAEKADFKGSEIKQDSWGYSGTGYVQPGAQDASISWQVNSPQTGSFKMVIVWANGSGNDKSMDLIVNGSAPQKRTFPGSLNWDKWNGQVVDVTMKKGENVITLSSKASGPYIDFIYFTESIFKSKSCRSSITR